ncbi:MAG TPA: cyclic nucleotide-binding domain-containing protein [Anaeromyxobacter sp.]|nr:cyclic nucleotide-binding domain-containing protein [Anaeromyxobacter sp.]
MASAPRPVWGDLATTAFVESSHLFKSLDPDARRDLLQVATLVDLAPGEILREGEEFHLVLDGAAAVLVPGRAEPVEIARLERGAFFGEGRVLGGGRAASLSAVTEVTVVAFPAPVIAAIGERYPKVRKLLEAVQAARERDASERAAS